MAFAATFLVLLGAWEAVLRTRSGATVDFAITRPPMRAVDRVGPEWVVFGNCLMMTGVSPKLLASELTTSDERSIVNIASHEQSPIAYFEYLRETGHYPDVVIANVSSWINGTNFDQEAALLLRSDPLGISRGTPTGEPVKAVASSAQGYHDTVSTPEKGLQARTEAALTHDLGTGVRAFGHRYHLFDYTMFVGALATSFDLDKALYQLNMQSWFTVTGSETDGLGYSGIDVRYRDDWNVGLERMADRSLQRLRLSRLLDSEYWRRLEAGVRDLQAHGTEVLFVRMPEHPRIRDFNEQTYHLTDEMQDIEKRTGAPTLDLSKLGPADGVHLFDAVHPDAASTEPITRAIAGWLRERRVTSGTAGKPKAGGS